jgi:hypothetical protein
MAKEKLNRSSHKKKKRITAAIFMTVLKEANINH